MEIAALVFLRSVIRYFVPGLAFYALAVCVPLLLVFGEPSVAGLRLFDAPEAISFGVVLGYTLDALGAYRWTGHYRQYRATREDLAARLSRSGGASGKTRDPDLFLAELWLRKPALYDRAMQERAEWVVVLEIAATLFIAAGVLAAAACARWIQNGSVDVALVALAAGEAVASLVASAKGVQRIWPYNDKVVLAASSMRPELPENNRPTPPVDRRGTGARAWIAKRIGCL